GETIRPRYERTAQSSLNLGDLMTIADFARELNSASMQARDVSSVFVGVLVSIFKEIDPDFRISGADFDNRFGAQDINNPATVLPVVERRIGRKLSPEEVPMVKSLLEMISPTIADAMLQGMKGAAESRQRIPNWLEPEVMTYVLNLTDKFVRDT